MIKSPPQSILEKRDFFFNYNDVFVLGSYWIKEYIEYTVGLSLYRRVHNRDFFIAFFGHSLADPNNCTPPYFLNFHDNYPTALSGHQFSCTTRDFQFTVNVTGKKNMLSLGNREKYKFIFDSDMTPSAVWSRSPELSTV